MQELENQVTNLQEAINNAVEQLHIPQMEHDLSNLESQTIEHTFWNDQVNAQAVSKQIAVLKNRIEPWLSMHYDAYELAELVKMEDESLKTEIQYRYEDLQKQFQSRKTELMFNGPYDNHVAIVSIHAGAGGTDAQDWTQMLLRMYIRYAEINNFSVTTIDQSDGEEAGIKSVTFEISGPFAYGKLKGEHGVHRLVRLSPFNSDNLRQTSFAKVEVMPKIDKPEDVEIDEKDLKIDVYRSGGKGGQSVNTTDSAVRITHTPTNIVVAIQNERSQLQNKETAMTILRSKLAQLQLEQHAEDLKGLKGPNQSAEWGNQIRSYVLHPYKQVKDLRTGYVTTDAEGTLDGNLAPFITAYLEANLNT